jgi:prevent-host-death family protein
MSEYSVADAKTHLPRLIDKAIDGEAVVITRHGKPVAELHPVGAPSKAIPYDYERLRQLVESWPSVGMTSVELLNMVYEVPE